MSGWRAVIELDEIWEGDLVTRKVYGIDVLFINIKGEVYAYRDKCPHAGTPLSQGLLEDRVLTCSSHLWQFDLVGALGSWSGCFGRGEACPPSRLRPSQK